MAAKTQDRVVVRDVSKKGKYVAMKNDRAHTIIAYSSTPKGALLNAAKKGVTKPIVVYVPKDEEERAFMF